MLQQKSYKIHPLTSIIMLLVAGVLIYFIFKGIYAFAYWALPVLAIATLIIDYKVYVNYGKRTIRRFKTQPIWGVLRLILDIMLFPLLILFLFGKAIVKRLIYRNLKNHPAFQETQQEGEFISYEEVEDEPQPVKILELPPLNKKPEKKNIFDDYFE